MVECRTVAIFAGLMFWLTSCSAGLTDQVSPSPTPASVLDGSSSAAPTAVATKASPTPNLSRLAFTTNRDGNKEIYVMHADGSNLVNLTNHPDDDYSPAWSPDGMRIAFTSSRNGSEQIYVMYV